MTVAITGLVFSGMAALAMANPAMLPKHPGIRGAGSMPMTHALASNKREKLAWSGLNRGGDHMVIMIGVVTMAAMVWLLASSLARESAAAARALGVRET